MEVSFLMEYRLELDFIDFNAVFVYLCGKFIADLDFFSAPKVCYGIFFAKA